MSKSPYSIKSKEFGRGRAMVARFSTLAKASAYIQARWQGFEYRDGVTAFHTDYCTYTLHGFTFKDIGQTKAYGPSVYDCTFEFYPDPDEQADLREAWGPAPEPDYDDGF